MKGILLVPKYDFCDLLVSLHPFIDGRTFIDDGMSDHDAACVISRLAMESSRLVIWDEFPADGFHYDVTTCLYIPYTQFLTHRILKATGRSASIKDVESEKELLARYANNNNMKTAPAICGLLKEYRK
jgi:hypothetical protein